MNLIFLSLFQMNSLDQSGIYPDLLRVFVKKGHYVRIVSAEPDCETHDAPRNGYSILHVRTQQMTGVSFIKKGIASLQIGPNIQKALDRYCGHEHYDLILMATPPITLVGVVDHIKKRDGAKFYLMLKDIWPQGIVDLGAISQGGPVYRYFRAKEKKLYALADFIGCMSPANVDYVLSHNPGLCAERVGLCPNTEEPEFRTTTMEQRLAVRARYGIPQDKTVFLYGGNFGRPQGIPFLLDCLRRCREDHQAYFVLCGTGTEYPKLQAYVEQERPEHVLLLNGLPREEYDELVLACDVGMLFLDYRFTIPNFPSRLLSYLQAGLPVISCTDPATDIGEITEAGGFGWKCPSNDTEAFYAVVKKAYKADLAAMGDAGRKYFLDHYTAEQGYEIIMRGLER